MVAESALSSNDAALVASDDAILPTPPGGGSVFSTGGTRELRYSELVSFSDLPEDERSCASLPPAFILATDANGNSSWADLPALPEGTDAFGNNTFRMTLDKTGMRYPGGDLTLSYFGKAANDIGCNVMADPSDPNDTDGLVSYKTTTLSVEWAKPEIEKARTTFDAEGEPEILIEVVPDWTDFDKSVPYGGVAAFLLEDYGTDRQKVSEVDNTCSSEAVPVDPDRTGLACFFSGAYPDAGDAIGVAALPDDVDTGSIAQWPPAEAISSKAVHSVKVLGKHLPTTKAGAPDSAQCLAMCTGDPVDTFSGNFFDKNQDLAVPGSIGLTVERRYAVGLLGDAGAFGDGTALNYDMRLEVDESSGAATVVEPSGNETPFVPADEQYLPLVSGTQADLRKTADGWSFERWDEDLTYVFADDGLLVRIGDPNGNSVSVERSGGRVSKVSEGDRWIELAWSGDRLASVTDHTGRTVGYQYDSDGRLVSRADPAGNQKQYEYDAEGRVTKMTFEDGTTTTNAYDAQGRIVEQTLPSGQKLQLSYGEPDYRGDMENVETSGDVVKTYRYDDRGRIKKFTDSSDALAHLERTYTDGNQIATQKIVEDGVPKDYAYTYSGGDLVEAYEKYAKATEAYEYDADHRITAHIDPLGVRTESDYDENGNLVETRAVPNDGGEPRMTAYAVDGEGRITSTTNPLGGTSTMSYDASDQLTSLTDPNGAVTTYDYDALGRITSSVSPGGNAAGVTVEDRLKFTTAYTYDELGNPLTVTDQDGTTAYAYDELGRPTAVTDPRGKTKSVVYGPSGQPEKIIYPDGSTDLFTYDPATEERASWTDPQGLTTTYSRDGLKRVTTLPDGSSSAIHKTAEWGYSSGAVTTKIFDDQSPSGRTVSSTGALESLITPGSSWKEDMEVESNKAGLITKETRDYKSTSYAYDGVGRLAGQTGAGRDVGYEYDLAGNVTGIAYPDGTTVSRELDAAGRVTKITDWVGTSYGISYNAEGQISHVASSTGLSYAAVYDGNRLVSKTWSDDLDSVIATFGSAYETSGHLASDSAAVGDQPSTDRRFQWNDNGALAAVDDDLVSWDGRLLTGNGARSMEYSATTGRLESSTDGTTTTEYGYDQHGNRLAATTDGSTVGYSWNRMNQLTGIDGTSYAYTANGIRSQVGTAAQVYGQDLKLLSDGENKYLWSPDGALLAQAPLGSTSETEAQQVVTDGMNSVHAVLDAHLSTVGEYRYSPFGERSLTSGQDATVMGFTSEQHDESGLIYLRYRYLDPAVGQFISVDPLVGSTLDPYGYADGNLLQMTDPLGLFSWKETQFFLTRLSKYTYRNSDVLSTGSGLGATALGATGFGAPVAAPLAVASYALNIVSTVKAHRDGDVVGRNLGILTMVAPSVGTIAKTARLLAPATPAAESGLRLLVTAGNAPGFYNDMRTIAMKNWSDLTCF